MLSEAVHSESCTDDVRLHKAIIAWQQLVDKDLHPLVASSAADHCFTVLGAPEYYG